MSVPLKTRARRTIRSLLLRGLVGLLSFFPLPAALALGTAVGRLAWLVARKTRSRMVASLAIAFPEKTPAEREAVARASLLHLARMAAEVVAVRSYRDRFDEHVGFAGSSEAVLREAQARGRGIVFVTGHVGAWELMARRVGRVIPSAAIGKAGTDARMNELIARFRGEGGVDTLWREEPATGRAIIRSFREGKALGLLIDQDTRVQGVFVPFFGRLAFTPRAAGDLALRFRAPVVVVWARRRGPGPGDGHEVSVVEVPYDPDAPDREAESIRITATCTAILEGAIRERPEEWVWMHERWRTRPPSEPRASSVPKSRELSAS